MTGCNKTNNLNLLNKLYFNQIYGIKKIVSMYLTAINEEITKENCIIKDVYLNQKKRIPYIKLDDGTKIRFISDSQALMEMFIYKQTEDQTSYSLIKYPANSRKLLYVDEGLEYRPHMTNITVTKDGIYSSIYNPYRKKEGNTNLLTKFYSNETINNNKIAKNELKTLRKQLSKVKPDEIFSTKIDYLDEEDYVGFKTLDYNLIQSVLTAESLTENIKNKNIV